MQSGLTKKYTEKELIFRISELQSEIKNLKRRKKYGLIWEDKLEQIVEECKNKLPVLEEVVDRVVEKNFDGVTNLIIEGDNYHTLSVLNYTHAGKVDLIYIDPPYNTGNKDFIYNDNYVDKEDTYRHSKWLSFISKRLYLAKNLLKDDGVIFISIDDNEYAQLKLICDEVFGENNLETIIWHKVGDDSGRLKITHRIRREHEYILVCYKNKSQVFFKKYLSDRNYKNEYTNPDNDPRGSYKQGIISTTEAKSRSTGKNFYTVKTPSGKIVTRQWRFPKEEFERLDKDNRIYYGKEGASVPSLKVFIDEQKETTPTSLFFDLGTAKTAGFEIESIFGNKPFTYPKPVTLIQHIIKIASDKDDLILDFMAGSGTTGHAVLRMNSEDGGNRQFILCTNNENNIAEEVTYPRIKKVIEGYSDVDGIPANLRYFKTSFVQRSNVSDDTRRDLIKISTEMICVKEGTFKKVYDNKRYKIYKDRNHLTGILFDLDSILEFKEKIKHTGILSNLYIFSLTSDTFDDDFADLDVKHNLCAIPESILEVYRKLFV